jgi:hypothetical protein
MKKLTIAIDFDGVLHRYSHGFGDGTIYDPPVEGSAEALQALKAQGHKLYIFSVRTNKIYHKDAADQEQKMKDWLQKYQIPFDRIWSFGKPLADIYIDDRAIGFRGNWQNTLQEVATFEIWNKPNSNQIEESEQQSKLF